ncbi:hypothetical protein PR048_020839 [Dryococelus australis]|uniref:Uncharacterized protein n=1 Tax=Dryococelus australis TaxID=614101 RepID=A0ABQ9GWI7_9NEOP|nr:hypothetical protein PR048_020839 [Dryococelus australis]
MLVTHPESSMVKTSQDEWLHSSMLIFVEEMRFCNKKCLQVFQKGCIMPVESLKFLFTDLKHKHPRINYLLTHRYPIKKDGKSVHEFEVYVLEYLAGWVAKKLHHNFPYLIVVTSTNNNY